jgi:hypothetical protein
MAHYYDKNGKLVDSIIGKNGKQRKTNIKDAKELKLFPSVTELLKIFDKPALTKWKIAKTIETCLESPKTDTESLDLYAKRIGQESMEKATQAKDFGGGMHWLIEQYLKGQPFTVFDDLKEYWPHVKNFLEENKFKGEAEKVMVNTEVGYAGTIDFEGEAFDMPCVVADFKTQSTKDEKKNISKKINYYNEWSYQLAGYALNSNHTCISVVISSDEPGRIEYKVWSPQEMLRAKAIFVRLCEIFSLVKNLEYSWWQDDIKKIKGRGFVC